MNFPGSHQDARAVEEQLLDRCTAAANDAEIAPVDQREACVFRLSAQVVESKFPEASANLLRASDAYFARNPEERLAPDEVVRRGWVVGLPRLRDMLCFRLRLRLEKCAK